MPIEKQATKYEKEQRVEVIMQLLSRFMSRRQILQYASKKTDWNVGDRQVDTYIAEAKEKLKEQEDPKELRGKIRKNLEILYRKNLDIDDYRESRAILESMAKLFGVNEPEKTATTHTFKDFNISDVVKFKDDTSTS